MNLTSIYPYPGNTRARSAFKIGAVFACLRNGLGAAREARRLYAMSDEALQRREGLTRAEIPARLANLL